MPRTAGLGALGEHFPSDPIAVEGARGATVRIDFDEGFDDLRVTPLFSAMRSWPRRGSRVPKVAAIVTELIHDR